MWGYQEVQYSMSEPEAVFHFPFQISDTEVGDVCGADCANVEGWEPWWNRLLRGSVVRSGGDTGVVLGCHICFGGQSEVHAIQNDKVD